MKQFDEGIIFSINSLTIKNMEYIKEMNSIIEGIKPKDWDHEKFVASVGFGDKTVKTGVVGSDIAKIALKDIQLLYDRIAENCVAIQKLCDDMGVYSMTEDEITALKDKLDVYP